MTSRAGRVIIYYRLESKTITTDSPAPTPAPESTFSHPEFYKNHRFRTEQGVLLYQLLFYEWAFPHKNKVLYTLKDQEHHGFPSLYRLYLETGDPTEYEFAKKYFDSYEHWKTLAQKDFIKAKVSAWREELDLKIRSEALSRIIRESKSNSKNSFVANKFILEKGYVERAKKGRPSKEQISTAAKELAKDQEVLNSDFLRVVGS